MAENSQNEFTLREASELDFPGIADFLVRHTYSPIHPEWTRQEYVTWLRWKFLTNPDGPGRMFIIEDFDKAIVGIRGDIPRRFTSRKTGTFSIYQGVDLLVDAGLREKGLYSRLRRFAWSNLDLPKVSFPSKQVLEIICRHGFRVIAPGEKWGFPLPKGNEKSDTTSGLIVPLVDAASRFYAFLWLGRYPRNLRMEPVVRFEKDFTLDPGFIHGVRSAEYLNWRFIDNAINKYSAYKFLDGDETIGYCVYAIVRGKAEIYDFIAEKRRRGCLRLLIEHYRRSGLAGLRFKGIGLKLRKFGFIRRRDRHTYYVAHEVPEGSWMMTTADRDY